MKKDWKVYKWKEEGLWLLEVLPSQEDPWTKLRLDRATYLEVVAILYTQPVEIAEAIVAVMRVNR